MVAHSVALLLVVGVALLHTGAANYYSQQPQQYNQPERRDNYPQKTDNYDNSGSSYKSGDNLQSYGQCGGRSSPRCKNGVGYCEDAEWPDMKCPYGEKCIRQSPWYYQCLPYGDASQTNSYNGQQQYPKPQPQPYKPQPQPYKPQSYQPQPQPQSYQPQPQPQPYQQQPQPQSYQPKPYQYNAYGRL